MSSVTRKFSGSSVLHPFLILCSNGVPLGKNDTDLPVGNPCKATAPHTPWPLGPPEAYFHRKDLVTANFLLPSFDLHPTVVFPAWAASSGVVSPHAGLWNWPRPGHYFFPPPLHLTVAFPAPFLFPLTGESLFRKLRLRRTLQLMSTLPLWLQTPSGSTSR